MIYQKRKIFRSMGVLLLSVLLLLPNLIWAFSTPLPVLPNSPLPQPAGVIPKSWGKITAAQNLGPRHAYLLEDLHCHYEVQKNIAHLIQKLMHTQNLSQVIEEGAVGRLALGWIRDFPDRKVRELVCDHLVKLGLLSGAEYAAINNEGVGLSGLEDASVYTEALSLARSLLSSEVQGTLLDLRSGFQAQIPNFCSPTLIRLYQQQQAFREGRLDMLRYGLFLEKQSRKLGELDAYPDLQDFLHAKHWAGQEHDSELVAGQLQSIEKELIANLCDNPAALQLNQVFEQIDLLCRLANISASPQDVIYFLQNQAVFNHPYFQQQASALGFSLNQETMNSFLSIGEKIYRLYHLVDQRTQIFADKIASALEKNAAQGILAVCGGFHTPELQRRLAQKGISYTVIRPAHSARQIINPYFQILQNQPTTLEKFLSQNQTMLGVPAKIANKQAFASEFLPRAAGLMKNLPELTMYLQKHFPGKAHCTRAASSANWNITGFHYFGKIFTVVSTMAKMPKKYSNMIESIDKTSLYFVLNEVDKNHLIEYLESHSKRSNFHPLQLLFQFQENLAKFLISNRNFFFIHPKKQPPANGPLLTARWLAGISQRTLPVWLDRALFTAGPILEACAGMYLGLHFSWGLAAWALVYFALTHLPHNIWIAAAANAPPAEKLIFFIKSTTHQLSLVLPYLALPLFFANFLMPSAATQTLSFWLFTGLLLAGLRHIATDYGVSFAKIKTRLRDTADLIIGNSIKFLRWMVYARLTRWVFTFLIILNTLFVFNIPRNIKAQPNLLAQAPNSSLVTASQPLPANPYPALIKELKDLQKIPISRIPESLTELKSIQSQLVDLLIYNKTATEPILTEENPSYHKKYDFYVLGQDGKIENSDIDLIAQGLPHSFIAQLLGLVFVNGSESDPAFFFLPGHQINYDSTMVESATGILFINKTLWAKNSYALLEDLLELGISKEGYFYFLHDQSQRPYVYKITLNSFNSVPTAWYKELYKIRLKHILFIQKKPFQYLAQEKLNISTEYDLDQTITTVRVRGQFISFVGAFRSQQILAMIEYLKKMPANFISSQLIFSSVYGIPDAVGLYTAENISILPTFFVPSFPLGNSLGKPEILWPDLGEESVFLRMSSF